MYGIINNSFKKYVVDRYGDDRWEEIVAIARVHQDVFIELKNHSDQSTIAIVEAAVQVTGQPIDYHLTHFGRFWVRGVALKNFRGLIDNYGGDFYSLLNNLNLMHTEISGSFLDYSPPSFAIEHPTEFGYQVTYQSHRQGFTPFVLGILEELAHFYKQSVDIKSVQTTCVEGGEMSVISLEIHPE